MSVKDTVVTRLTGDATLMALLTGGVYRADVVTEISSAATPAAFDANRDLLPTALVRFPQVVATGWYEHSAWLYLDIALFSADGHATLHAAVERIYALLHRYAVGGGGWVAYHTDDLLDQEEPRLHYAMAITRYRIGVSR